MCQYIHLWAELPFIDTEQATPGNQKGSLIVLSFAGGGGALPYK